MENVKAGAEAEEKSGVELARDFDGYMRMKMSEKENIGLVISREIVEEILDEMLDNLQTDEDA